jgi:hypothetical protein
MRGGDSLIGAEFRNKRVAVSLTLCCVLAITAFYFLWIWRYIERLLQPGAFLGYERRAGCCASVLHLGLALKRLVRK